VLAIIFIFAVFDSRAKMMMGDAGSNSIGAFVGVISALACPLWFNIIAILFHIGIQLYSEKHSITKLIAENMVLNKIDRLIGVRD
ncbi:MAG: glycosyltransferase, partial [Abditibacteriota bacterium]|nr:glycosyltransferase [Abditibacteriota bacterium]